jgi:L-amino acid N-acyltransferase YncA
MAEEPQEREHIIIRPATVADAAGIAAIYNPHVTGTVVTFEEEPVSVAETARRIVDISPRYPWLVCEAEGVIAGYAYASSWKSRSAYRFAVETTIYLAATHLGAGLGRRLYGALLDDLRAHGFHVALGCIALPNAASVALHERLGFAKVAEFPAVGWKLGRWVDVGYWQLRLRTGVPA